MTSCCGVCNHIKEKTSGFSSMYQLGFVWCVVCRCYLTPSKAVKKSRGRQACPCCGGWLRTKVRFPKKKELVTLA